MNKKVIIIYIVAFVLSLCFICGVALKQEPTNAQDEYVENSVESNEKNIVEMEEFIEEVPIDNFEQFYTEYQVPSNRGFKSYMSYRAITSKCSLQYKIQSIAYTGEFGIRKVEDRFCIAIGRFSNARVGTYVDLILENEIVIPCIVGDFKANVHTDSSNMVTGHNGCVSEFVVEKERLPYVVRNNDNTGSGNMSHCKEEWKSPVKIIKVYEKNVFDGEE